jgi:DNA invertase Pin-like site-specific DNA recombinase
MTEAICYLRVSTAEQTFENQEPAVLAIARARGWEPTIVREVESGAAARPQWLAVLELARCGLIRGVVVWSIDRIGRTLWQVVADVRELERLGCAVVSVREPWLDTAAPTRDLLLAIFAWVAEHERDRLRQRTRAGVARARAAGSRLGRPPKLTPAALDVALAMRREGFGWGAIRSQVGAMGVKMSRAGVAAAVARQIAVQKSGPRPAGPIPPDPRGLQTTIAGV